MDKSFLENFMHFLRLSTFSPDPTQEMPFDSIVPIVSWVEVTMAHSQKRLKGFLKGLGYSFVGIVIFLAVFSYFLPHAR